jgi:hypothetical protein
VTASNIVAYTCSNCTTVVYNAQAFDTCCAASPTLTYNPPPGTCFPAGSTTPVTVTATDPCGNVSAPRTFLVTVVPITAGCGPNNCIQINASNIVVSTCSNCVPVPYPVTITDTCCTNWNVIFNPPLGFCFPVNTTTPVNVNVFDRCGNKASKTFLVTVVPGANCGGTMPGLSLTGGGTGGTGTNSSINLNWPPVQAELQQSSDMIEWTPVPGATNPPYVIDNPPPQMFFRLKYNN